MAEQRRISRPPRARPFFHVAEEGNERDGVTRRFSEGADDEGKIVRGELRAAVRLDHVAKHSIGNAKFYLPRQGDEKETFRTLARKSISNQGLVSSRARHGSLACSATSLAYIFSSHAFS